MVQCVPAFLSLDCEWEEIIELGCKARGIIIQHFRTCQIDLSLSLRCSTGVQMRRVRCDK